MARNRGGRRKGIGRKFALCPQTVNEKESDIQFSQHYNYVLACCCCGGGGGYRSLGLFKSNRIPGAVTPSRRFPKINKYIHTMVIYIHVVEPSSTEGVLCLLAHSFVHQQMLYSGSSRTSLGSSRTTSRERERDAHALLWVKLLFDLIICWWDDYYMALWGRKCLGATASYNCCGYWPVMRGLSAPARYATTDPSVVSSFSSLAIIPSETNLHDSQLPENHLLFPLLYYLWALNIIQIGYGHETTIGYYWGKEKIKLFPHRRLVSGIGRRKYDLEIDLSQCLSADDRYFILLLLLLLLLFSR